MTALIALEGNGTTLKAVPVKRGRRKLQRGALKIGVIDQLRAAGKKGLTVKELAMTLDAKPKNISVWFYTTGKKVEGIKKVGTARYAYTGE